MLVISEEQKSSGVDANVNVLMWTKTLALTARERRAYMSPRENNIPPDLFVKRWKERC